jgi:hypothetical protein
MAAILEGCITEEQRPVVHFLSAKGLNVKDIHKEMFPVYDGKCLSREAVYIWGKERGKYSADDEEVETKVRMWLRQQVSTHWQKQVYQCWRKICREKKFFFSFSFEYHSFYVL